jgi:hypothetical protein
MFQKINLLVYPSSPHRKHCVFSSIHTSRHPVTPSVIHHGQNPLESEETKISRELKELVLTTKANNQATA